MYTVNWTILKSYKSVYGDRSLINMSECRSDVLNVIKMIKV